MSKKLFSFLLLVSILLTSINVYASEVTNQEEDPNQTASFAFNYDLAIKNVNIVNPARNEILYSITSPSAVARLNRSLRAMSRPIE